MQYDETDQTIISNAITWDGTDCTTGRIFLDSTTNDNQRDINFTGSIANVTIDNVDVEDSNAIVALTAENSTEDNDNNTNWTINAGAYAADGPTLNQLLRHGGWFNSSGVEQPYSF